MRKTTPCTACGTPFVPKRLGRDRGRRCPDCIRAWRWGGYARPAAVTVTAPAGGTWPELVAAELEKADRR